MSSPRHVHYTYTEYVTLEEEISIRHEYFDGEIYAMAGGTPDHAVRAGAPPFCRVFTSDLRIKTSTGLTTYPDAAVICDKTTLCLPAANPHGRLLRAKFPRPRGL
jgi:Uma2 family endonuclease